jgi:hypothetical protein
MSSGAGTPTSSISVMMLIAASFSPSLKHRLTASEYNLLQFGTTFSASIKLVCTQKKTLHGIYHIYSKVKRAG